MATNGRPTKSTAAQRADVRRLAATGASVRAIAAQIFGDARFRGRVERILQRPPEAAEAPEAIRAREAELRAFAKLTPTAQMRWMFERRLALWAARDEPPSTRELLSMADLYRRLHSLEQLERLAPQARKADGA
jgi:hypothetical protein